MQIADSLTKIKLELKDIELKTPLMICSSIIYFLTASFYQMSLRDLYLSDYYFKKIL